MTNEAIRRAADAIRHADSLLIGAGAGMGVDSGLPDFRGDTGFWKAYPPFKELGLSFMEVANPIWFQRDPHQAWGFYGHRLNLYGSTTPHHGFTRLREIASRFELQHFVFTSNVDGHFVRGGFDESRVIECHGSIRHLQCAEPCCDSIWPADESQVIVDQSTFRAQDPLPKCPHCNGVARPNILMFGDANWVPDRTNAQERLYVRWLGELPTPGRTVGIELGAGTAVPSVRYEMQRQTRGGSDTLIRINPRESEIRDGISIPLGAADALDAICRELAIAE